MAMKRKEIFKTKLGDIRRDNMSFWENLFNRYMEGKDTYQTLAEYLGLDTRTIKSIFKEYGWYRNEDHYIKTSQGYLNKDSLEDWKPYHDMYMLEGKSYQEVADFLNIERKPMNKCFDKFGFPKRSMSESVILADYKIRKANQEARGCDYPTQNKEVNNKIKETVKVKYGVDNVAKAKEVVNKMINSALEYNKNRTELAIIKANERLRKKGYSANLSSNFGYHGVNSDGTRFWYEYDITHDTCNTTFKGNLGPWGSRCPNCFKSNQISEPELIIRDYIVSLLPEGTEILSNVPILDGKHIDIYIPSRNIGFEYNGTYWHTLDKKGNKNYHLNKTELSLSKGIKLYHIWDYLNEDIIRSKIKRILGAVEKINILNANNLSVKNVNPKEQREFLESNHLHGYRTSTFALGLYNSDNKLVSLMSFLRQEDHLELVRYCGDKDLQINGAFGKLLSRSIKRIKKDYPNVSKIVTFAYRDWTPDCESSIYANHEFTFIHYCPPSLFFYDDKTDTVSNRRKYMKDRLRYIFPETFSEELTATSILRANEIYEVYDSGNIKYEYYI